jgi:phenylacetyl-CoA:acceptor oxidoreductase subunit 1
MTRWAMVADLRRCVGCQTCTAACKHANATPPGVQWRKVLDLEVGEYPEVRRVFLPVGCMHCENPPCVAVCPSTATRKRDDGIVTIDYDICIGCAYCAVACPYQARYKVDRPSYAYGRDGRLASEIERLDPARLGVAQKCTFCVERIDEGLQHGLTPGVDPAATPACANSCIAGALHFGDLDDPDSNVATLLRENKSFVMHEELGTGPGFHYLWDGAAKDGDEDDDGDTIATVTAGSNAVGGVAPWRQRHWDWRAAGNFIGGGSGAGLLLATALAVLAGLPLALLALVAVGLVGAGLLCVGWETGRPLRAPLNVFFHPQTSWMSREALVGLALFPLALAGAWYDSGPLLLLAAIAGLAFLYCQARILRAAMGIPAWRSPAVVPLILASGLTEGAGLFLAALAAAPIEPPASAITLAASAVMGLVVLRAWTWRAYRRALATAAPDATLARLAAQSKRFVALGHGLPLLLILAALVTGDLLPAALFLAGLLIALAGWAMKLTLVTGAAYNQGFAIARAPVRGAGGGGPGARPGWSRQP